MNSLKQKTINYLLIIMLMTNLSPSLSYGGSIESNLKDDPYTVEVKKSNDGKKIIVSACNRKSSECEQLTPNEGIEIEKIKSKAFKQKLAKYGLGTTEILIGLVATVAGGFAFLLGVLGKLKSATLGDIIISLAMGGASSIAIFSGINYLIDFINPFEYGKNQTALENIIEAADRDVNTGEDAIDYARISTLLQEINKGPSVITSNDFQSKNAIYAESDEAILPTTKAENAL